MLRLFLIIATTSSLPAMGRADAPRDGLRAAIERAIPLLERAAAGSADQRDCFTCHNQGLPILALSEARRRGFAIDAANYQRQLEHTFAFLDQNRQRFLDGKGTGGKADTAGSALWALSAGEWPPDATTAAACQFLLQWQDGDDHWTCSSDRPPSEASNFTTTFVGIRGLQAFGTDEQAERIAGRVQSSRDWLIRTLPQDNEDRVFRLWGLKLVDADPDVLSSAAAELIGQQQQDGGWCQLDGADSDAYATATALVALHETGSLPTTAAVYQRGVEYLLQIQQEDGSWHVVSRSDPFQSYYESGFPHGEDQFISTAATGWAVLALLATQPPAAGAPSQQEESRSALETNPLSRSSESRQATQATIP
jgi:hypothetical protein